MNTVLIIGSFWPYRQGSKRVIGLANNLESFGWKPIILTPPLQDKPPFTVIEAPFSHFSPDNIQQQITNHFNLIPHHFLTLAGSIVNFPDAYKGWQQSAFEAACNLLETQHVDAILSIWPITSHIIAQRLKVKYNIPWVADFPDLWSQNAYYVYGPIRRQMDRRMELSTIATADALITTSEPWAEKLRQLHHKPVYSITHGFDDNRINVPLTTVFTITHTGMLYSGKRNPDKVLQAVSILMAKEHLNPNTIALRFYGNIEPSLTKAIARYNLTNIAQQYGVVSHHESLVRQAESQLLLLLDWDDPKEKGVYTGKLFEYLGSRRPILATGGHPDGVVASLLNKTMAGYHFRTVDFISYALSGMYDTFMRTGVVPYQGIEREIKTYTHKEMTRKFAEILNRVTEAQSCAINC